MIQQGKYWQSTVIGLMLILAIFMPIIIANENDKDNTVIPPQGQTCDECHSELLHPDTLVPSNEHGTNCRGGGGGSGNGSEFEQLRSHIRTFINWGCPDEFVAENFDLFLGGSTNLKTLNPYGLNFKYSYLGIVEGREKHPYLLDYATSHGLTDKEVENMYLHLKEDENYTLEKGTVTIGEEITKLVRGWDPANDLNDDHYINDTEFANRVNTNASARYKNESRIPIYYWGPPTDFQINPGDLNYQDFILYYFTLITEDYDGLYIDTMRIKPALQGDTIVTEYPDLAQYRTDVENLLTRLVNHLPKPILGNGWRIHATGPLHPYIISGAQSECWARITTTIDKIKLDAIIERDNMSKIQLIQYNQIYHETTNPNRPDLFVEGITLDRDQIYALALYYLIHGDYTYFGYGVHGSYHLGEERWFNAVDYDVGQPLRPYYIFDDSSGYTKETNNILFNGDFEIDDDSDGNPDYWQAAEPVELDSDIRYDGNYSVKIQSETESNNNINKQFVTLEPHTTYTLSGRIKTENVTGHGAQIYPYGFDDLQESDPWIVVKGTTDWTFYSMSFTTGSDIDGGRINYRIKHGAGSAWFDDFHLTEGVYERYTVYARDFQNATVLLKTPLNVGDNTTVAYDLDGYYHPLNADGTLGTLVNTIGLMGGEGAILVRESILGNQTILKQGWNLISIPRIQTEQSLTDVLKSIDGEYDAVRWYDSADNDDPWKHYKVGKPFGNDLFVLNETMSFWIHITIQGGVVFTYDGILPSFSQQIRLKKGWNLVGYPSLTSYDRATGLNNMQFETDVDCIQWYNATSKTWHSMEEGDHFRRGVGYWIHVEEDIIWNVPL